MGWLVDIVEHVKCKICKNVQHISYTKDSAEGKICIDIESCKKRQIENNNEVIITESQKI